ncbi:MAG: methyltransferase domain-containing protein [Nitrospira sp.]|nr:methyltransferase domain-containing protein [Nitrospira sp.]
MSQPSAIPGLQQSSLSVEPSCHICGCSEIERICSSKNIEAQIRFLQRFHRRRLRNPSDADLADRVQFTQEYLTEVMACRDCGLVSRTPRPPAEAITGAYIEDRYGPEHLSSEFELQFYWAESKVRSVAFRLPPQSIKKPLVVEVGSFVGGFLAAGRKRGWEMLGVDPGKEVTAFCQARGLKVFCGTLSKAPIAAGTVDAVAIWNTFDQLPNPDPTLTAAKRILSVGGILVIRVPNGSCFRRMVGWHEQFGGPVKGWLCAALAWNNLLGFPYVYGYTLRTLDHLLARHGFTRMAACPDTLMTLTNGESTRWAKWEEKLVKWCGRTAGQVEQIWDEDKCHFAPWLDIYYRVTDIIPDTTITVTEFHTGRRESALSEAYVVQSRVPGKGRSRIDGCTIP